MQSTLSRAKDISYTERARNCIAQERLTNSKRRSVFVDGVYPTYVSHGKGPYLYDLEGKEYVDFICGLGSCLFGYADPQTQMAIEKQLRFGITHSLSTPIEVQVAEKIKDAFPFIDLVKFTKTGTEACLAAIRIARAYQWSKYDHRTSPDYVPDIIASEGYHGWSDEFVSLTPPSLGVKEQCQIEKLDTELNESQIRRSAAVIVEPIITDISESRIQWLRRLRKVCTEQETVLIFDEVITGFRFPGMSVAKHYGIEPDLIVLGKALGNGMPISVVGGKKEIMNCGEYFISGTFYGETLSLSAAYTTIMQLQTNKNLNQLWIRAGDFLKDFNEIAPDIIKIDGYPTRGVLSGTPENKALFMQECCKAGILVGPSFFIGFQHLPLLDSAISAFKDIILKIRTGSVQLEGLMPQSPFAQKQREKE